MSLFIKSIKAWAKFVGINKKMILMATLIPLCIILVGCAVMFGCTQLMEDASTVIEICFPVFTSASFIMGIAPVIAHIVRYAAPADVKDNFMKEFELNNPLKRNHIFYNKAAAIFAMSFISWCIGGVIAEKFADKFLNVIESDLFSTTDMMFGECIVGVMLLFSGLCFFISTISKNKKQATILNIVSGVVMVIISAVPFIPAVSTWVTASGIAPYFIPVFNTSVVLNNMVNTTASWTGALICGGVNSVIGIILAVFAIIKYKKDTSIEF